MCSVSVPVTRNSAVTVTGMSETDDRVDFDDPIYK